MEWIVLWIALSIAAGVMAGNKGRSGFGWFLIALLLSPLIAIIFLLALGPKADVIEKTAIATGDKKKCPACAELIKSEAIKCRFCGELLAET